ncbi:hypothetical protein ACJJTC_014048, partial [Scirpophaga incertulas]
MTALALITVVASRRLRERFLLRNKNTIAPNSRAVALKNVVALKTNYGRASDKNDEHPFGATAATHIYRVGHPAEYSSCGSYGVGLLYQNTGHIHYAQVLLNEIGKPPGPEMENCVEREGYAKMRTYMLGGDKHPLTGAQKEKYKQGSFAIREGQTVNLDVTSPGATVALGLIYLRSNNASLAEWLKAPTTAYQLDFVRPDLLMLRIIARGLVLWDSIEASEEWIEEQVPSTIKPYCFVKPTEDHIDYEAMNQAYCNIIAGASFAMGLRFAGSGDEDARDAVLHFAKLFIALVGKSVAELAGRSTLESCLCVCLLAAGLIMAGRGDLEVMRVCRRLRSRVPTPLSLSCAPLTHGGQ